MFSLFITAATPNGVQPHLSTTPSGESDSVNEQYSKENKVTL